MVSDTDKPGRSEPRFADLIGKVRRLEHDRVEFEPARPPPRRRHPQADDDADAAVAGPDTYSELAPVESSEYSRNGVQNSIIRKLRRGQYRVEDEVDLHGLSSEQARSHLLRFLAYAGGRRLSCVRVIHGKGYSSPGFKPVLKPRVRHWLREDPRVLAFAPAPQHDGGGGALYVLLRSRTA